MTRLPGRSSPHRGELLDRCRELALACVDRPYPYHSVHRVDGPGDRALPRERHPVFFGCFDWHSAVHAHFTLVRWLTAVARLPAPGGVGMEAARKEVTDVLDRRLTREALGKEADYLVAHPAFERPYGLAWLLALDAEVHRLAALDPASPAAGWSAALTPAVEAAVAHLATWLDKLPRPIRSGVHSQTAFAMGLVLDWARGRRQHRMEALVGRRALSFHLGDRNLGLHLEPSGEDFLSPALGAADLMQRLLAPADLAAWLGAAIPEIPEGPAPGTSSGKLDPGSGTSAWLPPCPSPDPEDGRLAHLQGLSLSRAWMLRRLAERLPPGDPRCPSLRAAAEAHEADGLPTLAGDAYAGAHWLGTFACLLLTDQPPDPTSPGTG